MFVAFEGIDGSGKTTLIQNVASELESRCISVVTTQEPYCNEFRQYFSGNQLANYFLFIADRALHNEMLQRVSNNVILCDRYAMSTMAYQGMTVDIDGIGDMYQYIFDQNCRMFKMPDRTYLLDLPVDVAIERIGNRGEDKTRYDRIVENRNMLERLRTSYNHASTYFDNVVVLDGETDLSILTQLVIDDLTQLCVENSIEQFTATNSCGDN